MTETGGPGPRQTDASDGTNCSFCGKPRTDVGMLAVLQTVTGQTAYLCDECVGVCKEIMTKAVEGRLRKARPPDPEVLRELHDLAFRLAKGCRAEPGLPKVIGDVAMTLALALEPPD